MNDIEAIKWEIEEEIGVEYNYSSISSSLVFPVSAQIIDHDKILISDPDNSINQTIVVSTNDNNIIWKQPSVIMGRQVHIDPATVTCNGSILGIDRKNHCVIELNLNNEILWSFKDICEDFYPVSADKYLNGDIIIADRGTNTILLVDRNGNVKWKWNVSPDMLIRICCVKALKNGNFLLTDEGAHYVIEANFQKAIVWSYGTFGVPGRKHNQLTYPQCAIRLSNGNTMIADAMNHRILEVNENKKITWVFENSKEGDYEKNFLFWPTWVDEDDSGNLLITDCRNKRVVKINKQKQELWCLGGSKVSKRLFGYPRSIQLLDNQGILVADTLNDRIIEINNKGEVIWSLNSQKKDKVNLFWPRAAERFANGNTLIADGRNKRAIIVTPDQQIIREVKGYYRDFQWYSLTDPHFVTSLINGNLLIVDSLENTVVEINENDEAVWIYNNSVENISSPLNDPHYAYRHHTGETIITDSGNDRILVIGKNNCLIKEIKYVMLKEEKIEIKFPRFCRYIADNRIILNDANTGNVFIIDINGQVKKYYHAGELETQIALKKTRSIIMLPDDKALVSDNTFCRIIRLAAV